MTTSDESQSKARPPLVFVCSGAADVGAIADQAARQLARSGGAVLSCLAGLSACVEPIMKSARAASTLVAIDGCPEDCAAKTLLNAGLVPTHHIQLSDLGLKKKESPLSEERVALVLNATEDALEGGPH